jgi:Lrp/AsnC family transcriptional regulator, leucine-responsive regulatory protein
MNSMDPGTASITFMTPSPISAIISMKPSDTPSMCGTVRRIPKLIPDVINIRLFGPGVIDETKAKTASAANSSVVIISLRITQCEPNVLALLRYFARNMQYMSEIDPINAKILRALSSDGRLSNVDLADKVGLSPSACLRRVQELERRGVISGYRAVLSPQAMGMNFIAYVLVGLSNHTKESQLGFEQAIASAPEVRECHNITGTVEYLLRIEARDLAAYKYFHTEVLGTVPQVSSIMSYIVMDSPKDERA